MIMPVLIRLSETASSTEVADYDRCNGGPGGVHYPARDAKENGLGSEVSHSIRKHVIQGGCRWRKIETRMRRGERIALPGWHIGNRVAAIRPGVGTAQKPV